MTRNGELVGAAATDAIWTQTAREQPRIGSTNLYAARDLTCEYATWRDQPRLVSTAEGGLIIRRSWVRAPPAPPSLSCGDTLLSGPLCPCSGSVSRPDGRRMSQDVGYA